MGTGFVHGSGTAAGLAAVLANPAIWRGRDCAPEPAALATGFGALDAALPGRGWPRAALTEIVLEREGIGEVRLTLPALVTLQRDATQARRDVVWIAPPYTPYAPALAAAGVDVSRLFIVHCATAQEALWAYEQALRANECGAAFAWLATDDARALRRLTVAAREGRTFGVLWRRPGVAARAPTAALRLRLAPAGGKLAIHVDKRRGGALAQPLVVDVERSHAHRADLAILPRPVAALPHVAVALGRLRMNAPPPLPPTSPLAHHLYTMAWNNAWANHRLLTACGALSQAEFAATRTSFFPSLKATLNHIVTVDEYYVDALERGLADKPPHANPASFFDPEEPFATCAELAVAQRAVDQRLVAVCAGLTDANLDKPIGVPRRIGLMLEPATRLLAHLFEHQIHHRGQAHAMLAGTSVPPPQLDEFFCANEAHLRADELAALGTSEGAIWNTRTGA